MHGGVAAVMNPPTIRAVFRADTPDGMWTLPAVHDALAAEFAGHSPDSPGFACTGDHVPGIRDDRLRLRRGSGYPAGQYTQHLSAATLSKCK